jgi:hypothetical protein
VEVGTQSSINVEQAQSEARSSLDEKPQGLMPEKCLCNRSTQFDRAGRRQHLLAGLKKITMLRLEAPATEQANTIGLFSLYYEVVHIWAIELSMGYSKPTYIYTRYMEPGLG